MVQPGMKPLRRDAADNRERILSVAGDLFARRGLQVTLDEVAHSAGLGVGTVYRRFPNKELLVEALFERRIFDMVQIVQDSLAIADAWDGFVHLLEGLFALEAEDQGLRDVIIGASYMKETVAKVKAQIEPLLNQVINRAKNQGSLRQDFNTTDLSMIKAMATVAESYCQSVSPGIWRRYLVILLDGLKVQRSTTTPLPVAALDHDQLIEAFKSWDPKKRVKDSTDCYRVSNSKVTKIP